MATTKTWNTADLVRKDKAHMLHPTSNLHQILQTGPLVMVRGEGVYIWDSEGKQYIDAFAGLWNINVGHGRRELSQAMAAQSDEVAFVPTFFGMAAPPAIELAAKLATMFPDPINHFQFTSGGAESNETAMKIARYYWYLKGQPNKTKVLSRNMAYHGIAMGALAATGIPAYHQGFGPEMPGFVYLTAPYPYRNADGLSDDEFVARLVDELEQTIAREGADTIAAFIGEPVQGAGGVVVPPDRYWPAMSEVLKKHNILLISDEVICGFGRTGKMFGMESYQFTPDIAAFAKGITSGYIPLGGVGVSDDIFETLAEPDRMFMHGFTYSGHPVACAVALRNIQIIEEEHLVANAAKMGAYLLNQLHDRLDDHPRVGNIRGKGLMQLVEFVANKETKEKLDPAKNYGAKLTEVTRRRGAIFRAGNDSITLTPPLIINQEQCDRIADIIVDTVDEVLG